MNHPLTLLAGLVACVVLASRSSPSLRDITQLDRLDRFLSTRTAVVVLGLANALAVWWWVGWHSNPAPTVHDEAAYLLQAELFALGRWAGAARPLPEFFAQMHVLTEPVLASKYPPGLSLLLTPFVAIGFPALGPMAFAASTGMLVFVLARRVGGTQIALLTWLLWSSSSAVLRYQASFLSQTVSLPLWLGTLYLLLEYRTHQQTWSLVSTGACLGMVAITRPVTAIALAVPVAIVTGRTAWRSRTWRPVAAAALVGAAFVGILPLQNQRTTGDWRLSPLVAYSTKYTPFDFPGFGYTASREPARLPLDLAMVRDFLTEARRQHTVAALPRTLLLRVQHIALDLFGGWRASLLLFALTGALLMPAIALFALATSAGLVLTYMFHAHWPQWTVYYLEGYPAIVFATAVGIHAFAHWIAQRRFTWRTQGESLSSPHVRLAVLAACTCLVVASVMILPRRRATWQSETAYQREFQKALSLVARESPRSIVFVDYGRTHNVHSSLIWNVPDLGMAPTWIAYHLGIDDIQLMRLAPDRRAYVYRADQARLTRLPDIAQLENVVTLHKK